MTAGDGCVDKMREDAVALVKSKRGYLLPHHRLLSLESPQTLVTYGDLYERFNRPVDGFGPRELEYLWLVILAGIRSSTAAHHISRFIKAGGTREEIHHALHIAALPAVYDAADFAQANWTAVVDFDWSAAYRAGVPPLPATSPLAPGLLDVAGALAQACGRRPKALRLHLRAALNQGVDERSLVRFLALLIFPVGLPAFVGAAWIWRNLILDGEVSASQPFQEWARAYQDESGAEGARILNDV